MSEDMEPTFSATLDLYDLYNVVTVNACRVRSWFSYKLIPGPGKGFKG